MLRMAAFNNLDLQIAKLIKDRSIDEVDKETYRLIFGFVVFYFGFFFLYRLGTTSGCSKNEKS